MEYNYIVKIAQKVLKNKFNSLVNVCVLMSYKVNKKQDIAKKI